MEELLPLDSYHAQAGVTVRRMARAAGSAFGLVMGSAMGVSIGSAVGPMMGALAGLVTGGLTGAIFAAVWGSSMLRMRRAGNERAYENDPGLMGESLEDSFRYRMPCSLVQGERLVGGTLYLDHGRGAFVPIRRLAKSMEIARFALEPSPFYVEPWREAPWWTRLAVGPEPSTLEVASAGRVLRFLTPDPDLAMARLRGALPAHFP